MPMLMETALRADFERRHAVSAASAPTLVDVVRQSTERFSDVDVAEAIGADHIVLASAWHANHPPDEPPKIMGQLMHLFESPNRFGLPNFYTLHVWAWKENPTGTFVNWHSNVKCDAFSGQ